MSLREFLSRLWHQRGRKRGSGAPAPKREHELGDSRAEARARFWKAVREGQSEAEAQCSNRKP